MTEPTPIKGKDSRGFSEVRDAIYLHLIEIKAMADVLQLSDKGMIEDATTETIAAKIFNQSHEALELLKNGGAK